ncbi:FG-GAP-like repeat-containing protein [Spirosoma sp.]|uniref:FG-GAP-like repeat-containing protein n=1 Tax=Spirosoma sp. TaxID=1899569 RepID=UPI00261E2FEC|nr:FG-GAP-like repeat-containing protein [Spirosoma sp.]MCX6217298.1 FG-GAP-like repeat-containing protein [Spirosoma sp.]
MRISVVFLALMMGFGLVSCQPKADRLFEKIDAHQSGIEFANNLTPNDSLNAFTFTNFYNGGGVGVGDFNHDGKPDLFFTGNQESSRLYINQTTQQSGLRFTDLTDSAGVHTDRWCTGVSVVDINQDGWDDIYVSVAAHQTMRQSRNLLFINQKTVSPTFREEAAAYGLDYAGYTTQAAFFDYDLDGDLDAFLLNTAPDVQNPNYLRPAINDGTYPSTDRLFRNEGVGPTGRPVFIDVSKAAGIRFEGLGLGVAVSDLNQDGYPDVYCSNDFISSDIFYLNRGAKPDSLGIFRNCTRASLAHTSMYGMGIDAADINNDGQIDFMQLDMLPKDNARQKQMLSAQDYDKKELSQTSQYGYQLQYMRNTLQLNAGNDQEKPLFSEVGLLAGIAQTDWSWSTLLADLDLDGHKDVFVTNGYRKNVTDRDFISFTEEFGSFGTDAARQQQRDKLLEKVPEIKLRNYAFRNHNDLTFEDVSAAWGLDELSYANGAAYADLDGDGDLDLIVNNIDEKASVFRNTSREKLKNSYLSMAFVGPVTNRAGIGAMVTVWTKGEKQLLEKYPVRGYLSSMGTGLVVGLGVAPMADSVRVVWPGGMTEVRYNVRANQRLTLRYSDAKPARKRLDVPSTSLFSKVRTNLDFVHQESDFVDFKTTPALHKMLSRAGVALAVGDLNGDAIDDIAVGASYRGSPGALFFGRANGQYKRADWMPNTPMEVGAILLFDADNDQDNDLLVVGGGNERPLTATEAFQPVLYQNDGRGHFTPVPGLPSIAVSSQSVRALDYDRDGDLDVLIAGRQLPGKYPIPAQSYLLRNDRIPGKAPHFTNVTAQVAPDLASLGLVCEVLPLDIDGDQDTDLVAVGEWMPLTVLENQKGVFRRIKSADSTLATNPTGWWNCVASGDFDGDGDADLLLGNEGLNTLYRASASEPILMYGKDFNDDGQFDPIMGYFINGARYPALPRDALNQQVIQFRRKFLRYADYAEADFDALFSEKDLDGVYRAYVSELRSCYAENLGNGKFRLKPLPTVAQEAPIFGFVVDDFDKDGKLDALATGNFYGNEANMGRQDASRGLLLKGDGQGRFVGVPSTQTGFSVTGDARRSYKLHKPERIVTAINNGPLVVHALHAPIKNRDRKRL